MTYRLALVCVAAACGRLDFDEARDCWPMWMDGTIAFGSPVELASLATPAYERDPFLSQDELTIYFSRYDLGRTTADVYTATRAQLNDAFGSAVPFDVVNTTSYESKMSISLDGLTLAIGRGVSVQAASGNEVLLASRASTADPWPDPDTTYTSALDAAYTVYDAELGNDGNTMYLAVGSGATQNIAIATRASDTDDFALGTLAGYVPDDIDFRDADPWADSTGHLLVFSRIPVGSNDTNIVYMVADETGTFGPVMSVPGVNSTGADGDPWLSPGACRIYFSSTRDGDDNVYVAEVP